MRARNSIDSGEQERERERERERKRERGGEEEARDRKLPVVIRITQAQIENVFISFTFDSIRPRVLLWRPLSTAPPSDV